MLMCIRWSYYCVYSNNALIMDHIKDKHNVFYHAAEFQILTSPRIV